MYSPIQCVLVAPNEHDSLIIIHYISELSFFITFFLVDGTFIVGCVLFKYEFLFTDLLR